MKKKHVAKLSKHVCYLKDKNVDYEINWEIKTNKPLQKQLQYISIDATCACGINICHHFQRVSSHFQPVKRTSLILQRHTNKVT